VIEALVIGRVGVDITPATPRTRLATATSFVRAVGGFAGNIATALARLGIGTAVVSAVGDDGHGDHVLEFLASEGVDIGPIATRPGSHTQVAFFEAWPPDRFPVTFYRSAPAPETQLTAADLPATLLAETPLVILSGALLAADPARSTVLGVLEDRRRSRERRGRAWTLFDLDWRPQLWDRPDEAPALVEQAAALSDVVIGSDEEFAAARVQPEAGAGGPSMIVLKHGPAGVSLVTDRGSDLIPGTPVDVVCGAGSGDALTAAFGAGLLRGLDPLVAVERGSAAGSIVAGRLMCSTAMPTSEEIDRLLAAASATPLDRQVALS
jgi:5-dehydro-2-deoxygluconokinase